MFWNFFSEGENAIIDIFQHVNPFKMKSYVFLVSMGMCSEIEFLLRRCSAALKTQ